MYQIKKLFSVNSFLMRKMRALACKSREISVASYFHFLIVLLLCTSCGADLYVGGGAGYGHTFKNNPSREGILLVIPSFQMMAFPDRMTTIGFSDDVQTFFTTKGQWYFQIQGVAFFAIRTGPLEFMARLGMSSFNFDKLDGRFGFGMFSPLGGIGLRIKFNRYFAVYLQADVQDILRFIPYDQIPIFTTGLILHYRLQ